MVFRKQSWLWAQGDLHRAKHQKQTSSQHLITNPTTTINSKTYPLLATDSRLRSMDHHEESTIINEDEYTDGGEEQENDENVKTGQSVRRVSIKSKLSSGDKKSSTKISLDENEVRFSLFRFPPLTGSLNVHLECAVAAGRDRFLFGR